MNEKTRSIGNDREGSIDLTALLSSPALGGAVVAGAIYDPKIPPLVGD